MPQKYHIETRPVPPRQPRVGKYGMMDWNEDCLRCHDCVKKACVYDCHRREMEYIGGLRDADTLFFECMGCFSCVQGCVKNLLALAVNPVYAGMGNDYWSPDIIHTTWFQAETARIPVSGAGYRGRFTGAGFDSMWTDMSEIVRPTRDGIHGREYISTAVDIGRKPPHLLFNGDGVAGNLPPLVEIPLPLVIDIMPPEYRRPGLVPVLQAAAARTGSIAIIDSWDFSREEAGERGLPHVAFYLNEGVPLPPAALLRGTRLAEVSDGDTVARRIAELKGIHPGIVVAVRVELDGRGMERAVELAHEPYIEVIHLVADMNGAQTGVAAPGFIKDMVHQVHRSLVASGVRDEVTIMAGGGIALAEHMAKQIICGADLVTVDLSLLIALECRLCRECGSGLSCPVAIEDIGFDYGVGRMTNLIASWHDQLIEVMGAMGIREVRRLRGETGRAIFFEDIEEETFGQLFGARTRA